MKRITLLFISILLTNTLFSQGFDEYIKKWSTYFGGQTTRFMTSVIDSEGNIIAAGEMLGGFNEFLQDENYYNQFSNLPNSPYNNSYVYSGGAGQSLIAKFSSNGELIQSGYIPFQVYNLQTDNDDNIYLWGTTTLDTIATQNVWLSTPPVNTLSGKTVLVKLNPDFSISWCTYIPVDSYMDYCFDENFNIYGVGYTTIDTDITTTNTFQPNFITELNNQNKPFQNGIVFKLNNEGQLQWSSYYGVGISGNAIAYSNNELITSFTKTSTNSNLSQYDNYYFTQNAYQQTPSNQIITKFDATNGQRTYSTYLDNLGINNIVYDNGFYYFFGETGDLADNNLISNNAYQPVFGGIFDMYLGKFDDYINPVWGTYIGGNSLEYFNFGSKMRLNKNGIYITFLSTSDNDFINSPNSYQSQSNGGGGDQVMMKFSLQGNLIWGSFFGGTDNEMYSSIAPIDDNSFYLVGSTLSLDNISTTGSYQENLSFHTSYPNSNFGNGFITKFAPENELSVQESDKNNFVIFPNPAKDKISIIGDLNKNFTLDIYNSLGQVVLQKRADNDKINTIDLSSLQSGSYFLTIKSESDNKNVSRHKLIIK